MTSAPMDDDDLRLAVTNAIREARSEEVPA